MIVLFQASYSNRIGGPARSLTMLINAMNAIRVNHHSIVHYSDQYPLFKYDFTTTNIYYKNLFGMRAGFKSFGILVKYIKNENTILWINGLWDVSTMLPIFLAVIWNKKIIIQPKGALDEPGLKNFRILKYLFIQFIRVQGKKVFLIHTSRLEEQSFVRLNLKNTYLYKYYISSNYTVKENYFYPSQSANVLRLVYVSRLDPKKGLLEAFEDLTKHPSDVNIILDIYGDGETEYKKALIDIVLPKNIIVKFNGWIDKIEDGFYDQYHYFWLPTKYENFGISILEALALGCPILTTPESSWEEIVRADCGMIREPLQSWGDLFKIALEKYQKEGLILRENAVRYAKSYSFEESCESLEFIIDSIKD